MAGIIGAIRAGAAYVELYANTGTLTRGLAMAAARIRAFGASVRAAGMMMFAAGVALTLPFIKAANEFRVTGDAMGKAARRTGFMVETLSGLGFAAEQSGTDFQTLERGIKLFSKQIAGKAGPEVENIKGVFKALGLTLDDIQGQNPEDLFFKMADAIAAVDDPLLRSGYAMQAFGKSGNMLVPLLSNGSKGIHELMDEAKRLGIVMSTDEAILAEDFQDAWNRVHRQIKMVGFQIGAALAPMLIEVLGWFKDWLRETIAWVKQNPQTIKSFFLMALSITALGAALIAVSLIINVVGTAIALLGGAIALAARAFLWSWSAAGIKFFSFLKLLIPLDMATGKVTEFFQGMVNWLNNLRDIFTSTWGGIVDAIAAGDLSLAMTIAWAGARAAFYAGLKDIMLGYQNVHNTIYDMAGIVETGFYQMWTYLRQGFFEFYGWLFNLWSDLYAYFAKIFLAIEHDFRAAQIRVTYIADWKGGERALAELDAEVENRRQGIDIEKIGAKAEREHVLDQERKKQKDDFEHANQELFDAMNARAEELKKIDNEFAEGERQAREELEKGIAEAAGKAKARQNQPIEPFKPAKDKLDEEADALSKIKNQVFGTFNALALRSQPVRNPAERAAKALEGIKALLEQNNNIQNKQLKELDKLAAPAFA